MSEGLSESAGMIFFVTVGKEELGEKLARGLVEEKIAACINIVKNISSIYRWKGDIEMDEEFLMIIKTSATKSNELMNYINKHHPYDTPECVGIKIERGLPKYLEWIAESTK